MNRSLLEGSVGAAFARYCTTSMLGMIGISAYILADTFFIANGVGAMGIAALNLVLPLYSIIFATGLLIGVGGAAFSANERGRGNDKKAGSIYSFCILLGLFCGLLYTAIGWLFPEQILTWMGASAETIGLGQSYFEVIVTFSPAFILNNILQAFVRNDHQPHLAMASMISGSLFNIVMDYVFIFPLGMGMFGAALATAFSPVVGICVMLFHLLSKRCSYRFCFEKPHFSYLKPIVSGGGGSFFTDISSGVVIFVFNAVLLRLNGNTAVAAYAVIANISMVINSSFSAIAQALQPIVSLNFGAGKLERVQKTVKIAVLTALGCSILFYAVSVLCSDQIISAFNNENNAELAQIAKSGIWKFFLAFIPMGINITISGFFQSVLDMKHSFRISLLRGFLLIVPFILLFAALFGMNGVWFAVFACEICTLVVSFFSLKRWQGLIQT